MFLRAYGVFLYIISIRCNIFFILRQAKIFLYLNPHLSAMNNSKSEPIDRLFDKHFAILVIYASRFVGSLHTAEDIVQDTFLKLYEKFPADGCSRGYLFSSVHNRAVNFAKANKIIFEGDGTLQLVSEDPSDGRDILEEQIEKKRRLSEAVCKLPPKTFAVLKKIYIEGYSYEEAASLLGISVNTVKSHMFKAMKTLRRIMTLWAIFLELLLLFFLIKG